MATCRISTLLLVPPPSHPCDSSVEEYFQTLVDSDDEYTADSDETDEDSLLIKFILHVLVFTLLFFCILWQL